MGNSISTLKVSRIRPLRTILVYLLLAANVNCARFNATYCQNFLANNPSNAIYLLPGSSPDSIRLSLGSCRRACGDQLGFYDNIIPRLNTWLLPVLFLSANAQYPSAAGSDQILKKLWRKTVVCFNTISHLLADPVDYTWILLSQLETWEECLNLAKTLRCPTKDEQSQEHTPQTQNMAIILAAFERVLDHLGDRKTAGRYFKSILNILDRPGGRKPPSQLETWEKVLDLVESLHHPVEDEKLPGHAPQTQNVAIILSAFESFLKNHDNRETAGQNFTSIDNTLRDPKGRDQIKEVRWTAATKYEAKIARNFVHVRTRQLAPAMFGVGFYAWQVIGAFVPVIGESPNPSGGRVAAALMLTWIIFVVLFGNIVGEVASPTAYAETIKKYLECRPLSLDDQGTPIESSARDEIDRAVQACLGTSYYTGYCYCLAQHDSPENTEDERSNTGLQQNIHKRHISIRLRTIAHMSLFVATVCAVAVTSLPPTYLSVRHAFFIGVGIIYHGISPALTCCLRRQWGLRAVRWKNAILAISLTTIFIINSTGLFFNNCLGWYTLFPLYQQVVIYSKPDFDRNDKLLYPIIASLCIGAQIVLCVVVSRIYSRSLNVMKLAETS
jgi:hypothetical protein